MVFVTPMGLVANVVCSSQVKRSDGVAGHMRVWLSPLCAKAKVIEDPVVAGVVSRRRVDRHDP